jgi:hypothetical protein
MEVRALLNAVWIQALESCHIDFTRPSSNFHIQKL